MRLDAQVRAILAGGMAISYVWGSFTYEILLPSLFAPDRLIPLGKVQPGTRVVSGVGGAQS